MIKRLITNAVNSYLTSLAGSIVGLPHIIEGFTSKNWSLLIQGLGELLIGLAANEKGIHEPDQN
jgi:hypothetical protein